MYRRVIPRANLAGKADAGGDNRLIMTRFVLARVPLHVPHPQGLRPHRLRPSDVYVPPANSSVVNLFARGNMITPIYLFHPEGYILSDKYWISSRYEA